MDRINFDKISSKENGIDSPKIMIKLGSFKIIFFLYKNYRNSYVSVIRKAQSARLATYKLERPAMRTDLLP